MEIYFFVVSRHSNIEASPNIEFSLHFVVVDSLTFVVAAGIQFHHVVVSQFLLSVDIENLYYGGQILNILAHKRLKTNLLGRLDQHLKAELLFVSHELGLASEYRFHLLPAPDHQPSRA